MPASTYTAHRVTKLPHAERKPGYYSTLIPRESPAGRRAAPLVSDIHTTSEPRTWLAVNCDQDGNFVGGRTMTAVEVEQLLQMSAERDYLRIESYPIEDATCADCGAAYFAAVPGGCPCCTLLP